MQAHLLPRGLRVRKNMAGRAIRRVLSKSADARPIFAAFVLSTHLLAFPIATQGVRLLDPAAVVSDRITRERNSDTFEAIWSLVEHMHYTGGVPPGGVAEAHGGWDRILVDTLQADDAHLAFRSHASGGVAAQLLLATATAPGYPDTLTYLTVKFKFTLA